MKKRNIILITAIFFIALLVLGCSSAKGDTAVITLEEQAGSTGYGWTCEIENQDVVTLTKDEVTQGDDSTSGAMGNHSFDFKGVGDGTTNVVFNLVRPWEEGVEPSETKTYTFTFANGNLKVDEIK